MCIRDRCDTSFAQRAKEAGKGFIVGGSNYGQGSSREHAALVPLYLGIKAVIVKSFARIHKANLVNAGILPLTFANENDYDKIAQGDTLSLPDVASCLKEGKEVYLVNKTQNLSILLCYELSERDRAILLAGGLIPYTKGN